jgi:hypothetical protein
MNRKQIWLMFVLVGLILGGFTGTQTGYCDDYMPEEFSSAQFTEYERQLNAILKTRRDEEKEFVGKIVDLVRLGRIPSRLVSTSYQWVHQKRPDTNYPFIYFEKVLRIQAKALNLEKEIPAFDFSIYKSAGQRASGQNGSAGQRSQVNRNFFSRQR